MTLPDLATTEDLSAVAGREVSAEDSTALYWLEVASDIIRTYCLRPFALVTETVTLTPVNGTLFLPNYPVVSVDGITNNWYGQQWSQDSSTATVDMATGIVRMAGAMGQTVAVTYTYGTDEVPPAIRAAAARIAAENYLRVVDETFGIDSETIGGYSVRYSKPSGDAVALTDAGMAALSRWRNKEMVR